MQVAEQNPARDSNFNFLRFFGATTYTCTKLANLKFYEKSRTKNNHFRFIFLILDGVLFRIVFF